MSDENFEIADSSSQKTSKYNSGVAQIMRLDYLWQETHKCARQGDLQKWNWILDRVWLELAGDLDNDDNRVSDFNKFIKDVAENKDQTCMLYQTLMRKELFLRRLQNELGKGTSYEESDSDYMDG